MASKSWASYLRGMTVVGIAAMLFANAHAEDLIVLGDDAYAPVVYLKDGKPAGLLPAILKAAAKYTGDNYDIRLSPWRRAYEFALRGDGGLVGVSWTTEREKLLDFSKPFYDDNIQIVTLKTNTFSYSKLEDLKGKVIGGINGASYGEEVDRFIAAGLVTVQRDVGQSGRLRKLLAGRLDAAFVGNGKAGFEAAIESADELRLNRDKFLVLPTPLTRDPLHLAFPKQMNQRAAVERFDKAVEKMRQNGELQALAAMVH
jgi:ABC-type amino acid transport substrate-binding protein